MIWLRKSYSPVGWGGWGWVFFKFKDRFKPINMWALKGSPMIRLRIDDELL